MTAGVDASLNFKHDRPFLFSLYRATSQALSTFFFSRKEGTQITIQEAKESLETPVVAQHPSLLWPL